MAAAAAAAAVVSTASSPRSYSENGGRGDIELQVWIEKNAGDQKLYLRLVLTFCISGSEAARGGGGPRAPLRSGAEQRRRHGGDRAGEVAHVTKKKEGGAG